MDKVLTVVVPAYNAEKYLRDNLESFCIDELLEDIEVLVVNDGSTDRSEEIAREYAERCPGTYRVVTKENGGHGSGINCGIMYASGKYYKVVDADDWVDRDGFGRLVRFLKTQKGHGGQDADVVYSNFLWAYDEGQGHKEQFRTQAEIRQPFKGVVYRQGYRFDDVADCLYMKMHNMTIKTEILREHQVQIDEHCYYVDTEYITYPIPYVETISFLEEVVYLYRIGSQGQSIGIEKMQKNEHNYDKVLSSLLAFYDRLAEGTAHDARGIPCTSVKKRYIARLIARTAAGKMKIMLSFPASRQKKQELVKFDQGLKHRHPDIYRANINRAVALLRLSHYTIYLPASVLVQRRGR